jgi:hypothetical protein
MTFSGGVVIGLLGVLLADKLAEKFFGVREQRPGDAANGNEVKPGSSSDGAA